MNNKGQTLVIFVIILPIMLIMLTLIVDLGFMCIEKRNIENNVCDSTKYYLENINDDDINNKVNKLLNKNIKNIDKLIINDEEDYIEIKVSKIRKSIYSIITNDIEISVIYKGYKEDNRIIKG
jgi:predicted PurR-regulated permease PerM